MAEILTKDSPPVVYEEFECARCGQKSDIGFLSFHDLDGMDYIYEDSPSGWKDCPPDRKEYVYVCYNCDWELMNDHGWDYDETDELEREEQNQW